MQIVLERLSCPVTAMLVSQSSLVRRGESRGTVDAEAAQMLAASKTALAPLAT